jgi:hypothetical protein
MSLEGSSGTSIRKTWLTGVPEAKGLVLQRATNPREMWQDISVVTEGTEKF